MRRLQLTLVGAGWLAFAASFFLIAVVAVDMPSSGWPGAWRVDFPGWQTTLLAFGGIDDVGRRTLPVLLTFLAALTNLVMLASPWAVLKPHWGLVRWLPGAMMASTFINAAAAAVQYRELSFGPGYWVWVGSFLAVAGGLLGPRAVSPGPGDRYQESRVA